MSFSRSAVALVALSLFLPITGCQHTSEPTPKPTEPTGSVSISINPPQVENLSIPKPGKWVGTISQNSEKVDVKLIVTNSGSFTGMATPQTEEDKKESDALTGTFNSDGNMQLSVGKPSSSEASMTGTILVKENELEGILTDHNSKHAYDINLKREE